MCSFELKGNKNTFKEFDFTSSLQIARVHFTGRQWLYREIEETFERNGSEIAGVVVTGAPGSGKSAVVAQLICSRTSSIFINRNIIGYHICSYSNRETQNAALFVRNMVNMIAQRVTEYRHITTQDISIEHTLVHLCPLNPSACFRKAVLDPLEQIEDKNSNTDLRYIVIDALDECIPLNTRREIDILTLIREHVGSLPSSVKLIMTSRPMSRILKLSSRIATVDINPADPRNIDDIDSYVARRVYLKYSSFVAFSLRFMSGIDDRQNVLKIMNTLVKQSQGNFLFVREVLQFSLTSTAENYGIFSLPQTLSDIYQKYFERAFPTKTSFQPIRQILEVLVATTVPLSPKDLFTILSEDDSEVKFEYEFKSKLNQLSHFLRYDNSRGTVNLYHKTLAEWLTSPENKGEPYYVFKREGCRMLATYYLNRLIEKQLLLTAEMVLQVSQYVSCAGMIEVNIAMFKSLPSDLISDMKTNHGSLLHSAALIEDSGALKLLIHHFKDVNIVDEKSFTPAYLATVYGLLENLKTLYKAGANINHVSNLCLRDSRKTLDKLYLESLNWGKLLNHRHCQSTMMRAAVVCGHAHIVRFLVEKDANLDDKSYVGHLGSVLDLAAEIGNILIVRLLHNAKKWNAESALPSAAQNNRIAIVKYFLESGVQDKCSVCNSFDALEVHKVKGQGFLYREGCETALHIAVRKEFTQLIKLLLSYGGTALNCPDANGLLPIHYAVLANKQVIVQMLLNNGASGNAPCHSKDMPSPDFIIVHQFDEENYFKTTCECNTKPLHFAAMLGFIDILTTFIEHGVDVLGRDCDGSTALHFAACHNQLDAFRILVENGADPNARSSNGSTPFHSAAGCKPELAEKMFYLIFKLGADLNLRDNSGMTVAHYVVNSRISSQRLITEDQYNVEERIKQIFAHKWIKSFMLLINSLKSFDLVSSVDNSGQTVLHILAKNGIAEGVYYVLKLAGDKRMELFNAKDNLGKMAIDLALARVNELVSQSITESITHPLLPKERLSGDYDLVIECLLEGLTVSNTKKLSYFAEVMSQRLLLSTEVFFKPGTGMLISTADKLSALLVYLRNFPNNLIGVIPRDGVSVSVVCNKPFYESVFHLLSFRMTDFGWLCDIGRFKWSISGTEYLSIEKWKFLHPYFYRYSDPTAAKQSCLNSVLSLKEKENGFLDKCLDSEGYSALHRAAQGANWLAIQELTSLGMDVFAKIPEGYSALLLSILYAVKVKLPFQTELTSKVIKDGLDVATLDIKLASKVATYLLQQVSKKGFALHCSKGLTVYHYAASRGMVKFIKALFEELHLSQNDQVCKDKNRITPVYLAQLYENFFLKTKPIDWYTVALSQNNPWKDVVTFVRANGNHKHVYPRKTAELFLLHNYLYKHFDRPFQPNLTSEIIKGLVTSVKLKNCKRSALNVYSTGFDFLMLISDVTSTLLSHVIHTVFVPASKNNAFPHISEKYNSLSLTFSQCLEMTLPTLYETPKTSASLIWAFTSSYVADSKLFMAKSINCYMNALVSLKHLLYKYIYALSQYKSVIQTIVHYIKIINNISNCRYIKSHGDYVISAFVAHVREQEAAPNSTIVYITDFIRSRMDWQRGFNDHVWPLPFLVKIIANDTARYDYLKSLNVGL